MTQICSLQVRTAYHPFRMSPMAVIKAEVAQISVRTKSYSNKAFRFPAPENAPHSGAWADTRVRKMRSLGALETMGLLRE